MTEQRRLAAIVSADVAGYSRLMGRDESGTMAALKALRRDVVDPRIAKHNGRIVKTTGDGLLLEFASVVDAVRCVIEMQTAMAEKTAEVPDERRIAFRVGVNIGDIIIDGNDIFGDGVNVAARLQEIAPPGGLCLSGRAHDDVRDRLDASFADMGPQTLKNIARPVQVWRWTPGSPAASPAQLPLALPDKPSIAVLPFQNMSGDPEQEYFADGIVEDIITELSRFSSLFVISRNSSFTYKRRSVAIRQVGRDLGVRYVVEGSIRRTGERIRVTAQLIDAESDKHIWAERYDRVLDDVFKVQEEVTGAIVAAIAPEIEKTELAKIRRPRPHNLGTYELAMRAWAEVNESALRSDPALRDRGIATAHQALEGDARCSLALVATGYAHWMHAGYGSAPDAKTARSRGLEAVDRAIEIDPGDHRAFMVRGWLHYYSKRRQEGIEDFRQAHALNPNDTTVLSALGYIEASFGDPLKGISHIRQALRLSPRDPMLGPWNHGLALAYFLARDYARGAEAALTSTRQSPRYGGAYEGLALNLVGMGDYGAASSAFATALELDPAFLDLRLSGGYFFAAAEDRDRAHTFLRIAAGQVDCRTADSLR